MFLCIQLSSMKFGLANGRLLPGGGLGNFDPRSEKKFSPPLATSGKCNPTFCIVQDECNLLAVMYLPLSADDIKYCSPGEDLYNYMGPVVKLLAQYGN